MSCLTTEQELLAVLRDRNASTAVFRKASDRLAHILAAKFIARLDAVCGPAESHAHRTDQDANNFSDFLIVPIMRAGLALVPAFTDVMPGAPVGIVGLERNEETAEPGLYYEKLPVVSAEKAVIVDPMLATGGSACLVASLLTKHGYESGSIYYVGVLAAPEGMDSLSQIIPRSNVIVAAVDNGLDDNYFIVPGLGDYGDRYYRT